MRDLGKNSEKNIEKLIELLELFEKSALGRGFALIVAQAEAMQRLSAVAALEVADLNPQSVKPVDDRLLSPAEAAKYCGISWPTLRDNWVEQYEIKSCGEARGRRFRVSELQRVIRQRENDRA